MSAKCYSERMFENLSSKHGSINLLKSSTEEDIFIFFSALFINHFSLSLLSSCFFLSRYFHMSLLRIGTPTPIKSTTAKIVKSIQSPHISFFFIIWMDKMMEADTKVLRKTQGFNVLVCVSLVCYVRATLQNSALYTTILENFRLKKTLENKSFSAIYGVTIKLRFTFNRYLQTLSFSLLKHNFYQ